MRANAFQRLRTVRDLHRLQQLTIDVLAHNHTAPPVQINPHELPPCVPFHWGFLRRGREHLQHPPEGHEERKPRSFIASEATGPRASQREARPQLSETAAT